MFDYNCDLEFTFYSSDFKSEEDLDFMKEDHIYSDEWSFPDNIEEKINLKAKGWSQKFGYDFEHLVENSQLVKRINAIISVTGDDEIITTDDVLIIVLHLAVAETISEIKISVKDTGISNRKGNYTEGWIMICPAKEADFTSVILRHHKEGVPLVFDITKLKAASAVRKQSTLEMDLESKYSLLYKASDWVDNQWFTYDYAQMSLVLATCIFDFSRARIFPHLYKAEGGCGGKPPWNNVQTALCGLRYFNKNQSTKSVLALMDECYQVSNFNIKPNEALYINASHYAQAGNEKLSQISNAKRYLKQFDKETRIEILESCKGSDSLPPGLLEKSIVVEVNDKLLGSAVAELRKNGLIMTELDVQLKQLGLLKFSDLLKDENMGSVKEKRELEKELIKKNGLAQLAKFSRVDVTLDNIEESAISIMARYYETKSDVSDVSSLIYAGILRIFKTQDVEEYFRENSYGLSDEIITGVSILRTQNLNLKTNQAKDDLVYQIDWLEQGTLTELFDGEIPPSMGSDDARIARKILDAVKLLKPEGYPLIFVIVTDDKRLVDSINKLIEPTNVWAVRHSVYDYIKGCNKTSNTGKVEAYNFLRGINTKFDGIETAIRASAPWRLKTQIGYKILIDFPNVNRSLLGFFSVRKNMIGKRGGGFLKRTTAKSMQYSLLAWEDFKNLKDFEQTVKMYTV
jgi:hypothetical protein